MVARTPLTAGLRDRPEPDDRAADGVRACVEGAGTTSHSDPASAPPVRDSARSCVEGPRTTRLDRVGPTSGRRRSGPVRRSQKPRGPGCGLRPARERALLVQVRATGPQSGTGGAGAVELRPASGHRGARATGAGRTGGRGELRSAFRRRGSRSAGIGQAAEGEHWSVPGHRGSRAAALVRAHASESRPASMRRGSRAAVAGRGGTGEPRSALRRRGSRSAAIGQAAGGEPWSAPGHRGPRAAAAGRVGSGEPRRGERLGGRFAGGRPIGLGSGAASSQAGLGPLGRKAAIPGPVRRGRSTPGPAHQGRSARFDRAVEAADAKGRPADAGSGPA
jgi:hypothetical protein